MKKKVTKLDIWMYWNGMGVATTLLHDFSAASARRALAVQIERAALAHVSEPSMMFHDGLHARHHGVRSVLKRHARVRSHLVRVSK